MSHDNAPRWNLRVPHAPSTREVIRAKTSRMLRATISTSEGMFFKLNSRLDGFKQHSLMTIRTQIRGRQMEVRLPSLEEQIHTLGTCRQIHPFGFHRQIKTPRCRIDSCRSPFIRVRRPFKVKTNSGTLFPKHDGACPKVQVHSTPSTIFDGVGEPTGYRSGRPSKPAAFPGL